MINQVDYVELGLACANVCTTLDRSMDGRQLDDLNQSVREAIGQLTTYVEPTMYSLRNLRNLPTTFRNAGLWRICNGRSSSWENGMESLDSSTQRTIKIRSPFGSQISTGSFISLTWVTSVLHGSLLTLPLQTELIMNTHVAVSDIHMAVSDIRSDVSKIREGIDGQVSQVSETPSLSFRASGY